MKISFSVLALLLSLSSFAADLGYLNPSDMPYYKNAPFEGENKLERINSLVREVNKVYGELYQMKGEIAKLKKEVAELKAKK